MDADGERAAEPTAKMGRSSRILQRIREHNDDEVLDFCLSRCSRRCRARCMRRTSGPVTDPIGVVSSPRASPSAGPVGFDVGPTSTQGIDERARHPGRDQRRRRPDLRLPRSSSSPRMRRCTAEGGQLAASSSRARRSSWWRSARPAPAGALRRPDPVEGRRSHHRHRLERAGPDRSRPAGGIRGLYARGDGIDQAAFAAHYAADIQKYTTAATIHGGSPLPSSSSAPSRDLQGEGRQDRRGRGDLPERYRHAAGAHPHRHQQAPDRVHADLPSPRAPSSRARPRRSSISPKPSSSAPAASSARA